MAGMTPFGNETYADPGYQKDGLHRYPLTQDGKDDETRIRAAYSYICQTANQEPYTAAQVASIKARIMTAGRRIGITYDADSK
jgi:hypothetical protein